MPFFFSRHQESVFCSQQCQANVLNHVLNESHLPGAYCVPGPGLGAGDRAEDDGDISLGGIYGLGAGREMGRMNGVGHLARWGRVFQMSTSWKGWRGDQSPELGMHLFLSEEVAWGGHVGRAARWDSWGLWGHREGVGRHLQSSGAPWEISRQVIGFESCLPKERAAVCVSPVHIRGN